MAFRIALILAFVCLAGVFWYASYTEQEGRQPEHYVSPFGPQTGKALPDGGASEGQDLSRQHLSAAEIGRSLPGGIADVLTFNKDNYKETVERARFYFTPNGYNQYLQFLNTAGIEQMLIAQNLQAGAYAEQDPLVLTHGVFDNAYKWVYEVPVTISFTRNDAQGYDAGDIIPQNRRFLLRAQLARVYDPQYPGIVRMEIWQVLPPRRQ